MPGIYDGETFKIILNQCISNISQLNDILDPVTKNCMFLDKLRMHLDIASIMMATHYKQMSGESTETSDVLENIKFLKNIINLYMDELFIWVQNPVYSPEHPVGYNMMINAKDNFNKNIEKLNQKNIDQLNNK